MSSFELAPFCLLKVKPMWLIHGYFLSEVRPPKVGKIAIRNTLQLCTNLENLALNYFNEWKLFQIPFQYKKCIVV